MQILRHISVPILLGTILLLPGCVGIVMADATRKESRSAISRVMAEERSELDSTEAANCVLKAMSLPEIGVLGVRDNYKKVYAKSRKDILTYAARPEAVGCLGGLTPVDASDG